MKVVVAAFNQEKALVGAFSVITNLRMDLFEALFTTQHNIGEMILEAGPSRATAGAGDYNMRCMINGLALACAGGPRRLRGDLIGNKLFGLVPLLRLPAATLEI